MTDKVPEWVHMAEVPPPVDEEPWCGECSRGRCDHCEGCEWAISVGGASAWGAARHRGLQSRPAPSGAAAAYAVLVVLALVAFVVWRLTRG